jgi:hypothetical protein
MTANRQLPRQLLILGGLTLAGCAALLLTSAPLPADPPGPPSLGSPPKKLSVEEYRKLYPFESLADRLNYEADRAKEAKDTIAVPRMTGDTARRLENFEKTLGQSPRWDMRRKTLEILHSNQAEEFVKRDGFGLSRMPTPSLISLELPPAPTIPFAVPKESTNLDTESKVVLPLTAKEFTADKRLPSLDALGTWHVNGEWNFLNPNGFGFMKDREHVSGFQSHQFRGLPKLAALMPNPQGAAEQKEQWLVTRLELVSLLKQKEPMVYVAKELPRMEELKKAKTRALSDFEAGALASLRDGEDVITDATTNHIRMVGALRATKQCLECHEVRRGDLLGAFSYDIVRDPPLKSQQ